MKISQAYPSKYVSAPDIGGRTVKLQINRVAMETLGDDHKPVVYFAGHTKGLVLNKTNASVISGFYGDDTDTWQGKIIELFSMKVQFKNDIVDAIRVRVPADAPTLAQSKPATVTDSRQMVQMTDDELDEEIPF